MVDPDKIVDKNQIEHPSVYQSKNHPKHFESEGGEYIGQDFGKRKSKEEEPPQEPKNKNMKDQ